MNVTLLERILTRAGYTNLKSTQNPLDVLSLFQTFRPDIVLLDLHMPQLNGFEVLEQLRGVISADDYVPILVLTADITAEAKSKALTVGAKDFLTKPFEKREVLLRINNLLETRFLHLQLQDQNQQLEAKVRERTKELEAAQVEILELLARAAEYRDDVTGQHTQRVGDMSAEIGRVLGFSEYDVALLRAAATLHDIGKIGIPDGLLLKPGKFTPEEYEQMKTHARIGASILSGSQFKVMQLAEQIALSHHERWDGTGYPLNRAGEDIPLAGRIVSLADFFDALTHERPYKTSWTVAETVAEIQRMKGSMFDPQVVDAFIKVLETMEAESVGEGQR